MTETIQLLSSLAVPGSAIGALVIGIVAMLRLRSTDREALSSSQRTWVEKLEAARDAAELRADRFRDQADAERTARIEAEGRIAELQSTVTSLEVRLQNHQPPTQPPTV